MPPPLDDQPDGTVDLSRQWSRAWRRYCKMWADGAPLPVSRERFFQRCRNVPAERKRLGYPAPPDRSEP